jgi:hypothetical protein
VSRKVLSLLLGLVLLALPAMAQASISDAIDTTGLLNRVKFTNYEAWVARDGSLIAPGQEGVNDFLVSIFSAESVSVQITPNSGGFGPATWQAGANGAGYFLGYAVQELAQVVGTQYIYKNPTLDPLSTGQLAAGEQVVLVESTTDWVLTGNVAADVASIFANATPWATLGQVTGNNFAEFTALPGFPLGIVGIAKFALDAVTNNSGIQFQPGVQTSGSDVTGGAIIYAPGLGQWVARSEDPLLFAAVPEPATLAMWGSFLAIGAVVALRRRRK